MDNPYGPAIKEIEQGLWDHDTLVDKGFAPHYEYSDDEFRAALKIFMSAIMARMFEHQENQGISLGDREIESFNVGSKISHLIEIYTGIETKKLYDH
jgi:hypothetical protein